MSEAFKCDECGDYHDGLPDQELFKETHNRAQKLEYVKLVEFCEGCAYE